jgi:two-component system, NtrC family, response regulator AtoC
VLERAAILASGPRIRAADLQPLNGALASAPTAASGAPSAAGRTLADLERDAIRRALEDTGGNRREAAERLGIGLRTLYDKLKRYRLEEG